MSQENVEIARKAIEAWNAGDMDALRDLYDPDAVYATPSDWLGGPWIGRDAVMEQFAELRDIYRDSTFEGADVVDLGNRVVVQVAFRGDTRGLALSTGMAWVYTLREGLITRLEIFHSREEALEAAGRPE